MLIRLRPYSTSWVAPALAFLMTMSLTSVSRAALVGFDNFNSYTNGSNLHGGTGGFGWAGNSWQHVAGSQPTATGGMANLVFSSGIAQSRISRTLSSTLLGATGTTTWVRFNGDYFNSFSTLTPPNSPSGGLSLYENGSERLRIGKFNGTTNWSVGLASFSSSTVSTYTPSDLWVRINHSAGADSVSLWVNPADTSSEANLGTAAATLNTLDINFDQVMLFGDIGTLNFSTDTWNFDNVRIGTSFGAMSAVPEPTSLWLVGLALSGLGFVRRRARS